MIIKSMPKKDKCFLELYNYFNDNEKVKGFDSCLLHNLYSNSKFYMMKSFYNNSNLLSHKKHCNFLYHEVITLKQNIKNVSIEKQKAILKDLGVKYLSQRAKYNLAYGVIHQDKQHIHLHLMISANELESKKRHYLTKKAFNTIEKDLERYVINQYPELQEKALLNKKENNKSYNNKDYYKSKAKNKDKELNYKRRTGKQSKKDLFKTRLKDLFSKTKQTKDFLKHLEQANIKVYVRGQAIGFIDLTSNKRYRLKTLGLEQEFNLMSARIEKQKERLKDFENKREQKEQVKEQKAEQGQHKKQTKDYKSKLNQRIQELKDITEQKELNKDKDFDI